MNNRKLLALFLLSGLALSAVAQQKYVGGDISMLPEYVNRNAIYKDKDGQAVEPLAFFGQQGMNAMRVRLFVDPSKASAEHRKQGAIQDLDYVVALAKDIKAAGMALMLDFHYSDTWTDPGKHSTPSAWSSMSVAERTVAVGDYTRDCLRRLKAEGAAPDLIQPGNEITYGMLWPTGHVYPAGGGQDGGTWDIFAGYLASAVEACREECPQAQIVIQTEMHRPANVIDFYRTLANYPAVSYDVIGLSYYPDYHGTLETLDDTLLKLEAQYPDKTIMIVETGYGFKWQISGATYNYTATYPVTEEGQRQFTADLVARLGQHEAVTGLFWWYPEDNLYNIVFKDGQSADWSKQFTAGYWNASLFNQETGRALPALYELGAFVGSAAVNGVSAEPQPAESWFTLDGRRMQSKPVQPGIYIHGKSKVVINGR